MGLTRNFSRSLSWSLTSAFTGITTTDLRRDRYFPHYSAGDPRDVSDRFARPGAGV
ncbi:hypothetical protein [Mycobacterium sp. 1245805.9]|uniref:hypothetical protein n=1 Tax=Mycobacterium sp. 1245805.9 TaxID=1856862 RepID=UPI0012EABFCF|nr:hypothetical protein [Mycobacterium sp. 1245805.9]